MSDIDAHPPGTLDLEIHYQTPREFLAAYTERIIGGGLFLRHATPPPLNSRIQLRFTLPGLAQPFEIQGLVVWHSPTLTLDGSPWTMGVKFLNLTPAARGVLTHYRASNQQGGTAKQERAPAPEPHPEEPLDMFPHNGANSL